MARVKRGVAAHRRHKRLLNQAEGRRGTRSTLVRPAREALIHALVYAYRDRRDRKRDMRRLWIERINAASRQHGLPYGRFIAGISALLEPHRASMRVDSTAAATIIATVAIAASSDWQQPVRPLSPAAALDVLLHGITARPA